MEGPETWGIIVELQLFFYLATSVIAWGNKEFLLREFSQSPAEIDKIWNSSFYGRSVLFLLPACALSFLLFDPISALHLSFWITSRFITQSYEAYITYNKKFGLAISAEIVSLLTGIILLLQPFAPLNLNWILITLSVMSIIKVPFFLFLVRPAIRKIGQYKHQLIGSLPFFLLAVTGFLATKADLLVVDLVMDKKQLGTYHILSNLLILIRSFSAFALYPFVKNIYRMNKDSVKRLGNNFFLTGIVLTIAGLAVSALILFFIYETPAKPAWIITGFLYILPGFWYAPFVFYLFGIKQQNFIVIVNCILIIVNTLASLILIPLFSLTGALIACTISQILMLILVYIRFRKY